MRQFVVTNNGQQFIDKVFKQFLLQLDISTDFPQ